MNNYNLLKVFFFVTILTLLISACKESELNIGMPIVSTEIVTNITSNSAYCGGNVTSDGGAMVTTRGVVWSTSQNPTISLNTKTIDGDSIGKFTSKILRLTANTTYYIRAYATNINGTSYGIELSFNTPVEDTNGTFTDERDGNIYKWVKIGNQIWMAENLRYLPSVVGPELYSTKEPYRYVYDYYGVVVSEAKATNNYKNYGVLYNYWGARQSIPEGWHLPLKSEWDELIKFAGGRESAGIKLKKGLINWNYPIIDSTNETNFTALPGGSMYSSMFNDIGSRGIWWCANGEDEDEVYCKSMSSSNNVVDGGSLRHSSAASVRCIRD